MTQFESVLVLVRVLALAGLGPSTAPSHLITICTPLYPLASKGTDCTSSTLMSKVKEAAAARSHLALPLSVSQTPGIPIDKSMETVVSACPVRARAITITARTAGGSASLTQRQMPLSDFI